MQVPVASPAVRSVKLDGFRKAYHGCHDIVTIGEESPQSCRLLSYLAPHCPTNIHSLPETVRSGAGSVNPKPPAHGARVGSNQPWFLQGTRCDDPKTIEPVSAPNWRRFFMSTNWTTAAVESFGRSNNFAISVRGSVDQGRAEDRAGKPIGALRLQENSAASGTLPDHFARWKLIAGGSAMPHANRLDGRD